MIVRPYIGLSHNPIHVSVCPFVQQSIQVVCPSVRLSIHPCSIAALQCPLMTTTMMIVIIIGITFVLHSDFI